MGVEPEFVDDPRDERIADYVGLRDPQLRVSVEAAGETAGAPHGRFIVEGALAVARLVGSSYPVRSVLIADRRYRATEPLLAGLDPSVPRYVATQAILNTVAGFNLHRGVVASAARLPWPQPAEVLAAARRVLIIEGGVDHENLGSLFRNAAAFGVDGVVLDPTCADPFYRRAVRVSMGHVLRMPIARSIDLPATIRSMQTDGWVVLALTPSAVSVPLPALPKAVLEPDARVAVLVGAEGPGLTPGALDAADLHVRIEMSDGVDSLNIATAAAIALHHLPHRSERSRPRRARSPACEP